MRMSVGGTAGMNAGQGTTPTPRPLANSSTAAYGDPTMRAKQICLGLFGLLVILHSKGSKS